MVNDEYNKKQEKKGFLSSDSNQYCSGILKYSWVGVGSRVRVRSQVLVGTGMGRKAPGGI